MRELVRRRDVPRREDQRIRRAQIVVDLDAVLLVVFDTRGFQIQPLDCGNATHANNDFVSRDLLANAVTLDRDHFLSPAPLDAGNLAASDDVHAVADDRALDALRSVAILAN